MHRSVLDYLENLGDVGQIDDPSILDARLIVLDIFENNLSQEEIDGEKVLNVIRSSKEKIISRMKGY